MDQHGLIYPFTVLLLLLLPLTGPCPIFYPVCLFSYADAEGHTFCSSVCFPFSRFLQVGYRPSCSHDLFMLVAHLVASWISQMMRIPSRIASDVP